LGEVGLTSNFRLPAFLALGGLLFAGLIVPGPALADTISCPTSPTPFKICADYESSITGNSKASTIETSINTAITSIESQFFNPITVYISFDDPTVSGQISIGSNIGENVTNEYLVTYSQFIQALALDDNRPYDVTAMLHLDSSATVDPVNGNSDMLLKSANAEALGFSIPNVVSSSSNPDGTVYLNIPQLNLSRTGSISNSKYDLQSVVMHEIDEVLGLGSTLGQSLPSPYNTYISPEDLFRYDANGNRTFSTATEAWFELTPGTKLIQFNNNSSGDYGDWAAGGPVLVQNAFGTQGKAGQVNLSSYELIALDSVGYDLTPEPSTWLLLAGGLLAIAGLHRTRRNALHSGRYTEMR
jgi:PEP-CTERM motif